MTGSARLGFGGSRHEFHRSLALKAAAVATLPRRRSQRQPHERNVARVTLEA
jgi:hypothetical protein